jgi:phage terminase small subunit
MRQRGRKSSEALSITPVDHGLSRLQPPASLNEPERNLFVDLVTACYAKHFQQSDLPLLIRYVEAACLAEQAAGELRHGAIVGGKPSPWITVQEKAVRAMISLSARLRLAPQSRVDPKTLARYQPSGLRKPWEL